MTPTVRILLSETASRHLADTGRRFFSICGMEPSGEHPGRFVIHLREWPDHLAAEARSVLLGTHRAVKIETELFK
jgi:hypothetical protein